MQYIISQMDTQRLWSNTNIEYRQHQNFLNKRDNTYWKNNWFKLCSYTSSHIQSKLDDFAEKSQTK